MESDQEFEPGIDLREKRKILYEGDRFAETEGLSPWRKKVNEVIFGFDTPAGRNFDIALLVAILLSVLVVMLESVSELRDQFGELFIVLEWVLTILFTFEYLLRLSCVRKPWDYAISFYGVIDLLAILPTYVAVFLPGSQSLIVIRALRLIRVFRVLRIAHCLREAENLWIAWKATQSKIAVFLLVVLTLVLIMGSTMYLIEGPENGFSNIPISVYWAIVTMTTVGYGDIAPQTVLGQILASVAMVLGYGIIIVPTGIFSVEVISAGRHEKHIEVPCSNCDLHFHERDAVYCRHCGSRLPRKGAEEVSESEG